MFTATHLGHLGWLIEAGASRVLVDPLLGDEYSAGFSAEIYPPRRFTWSAFPAIDAVVLSHEHADHLQLASLARLDRRVPVLLPARAAAPLRDAVAALGFPVVATRPGDRFAIGGLEVRLLGGVAAGGQLDWELTCLQTLIADRAGHGSFYSYADAWPTPHTLAAVRRAVGTPGVLCHANNTMDWTCLEAGPGRLAPPTALGFAAELASAEATWWADGPAPAVTAICGPGLAFRGDDAWLNQILCVDSERVRDALQAVAPPRADGGRRVIRAPAAGERYELVRGALHRIAPRAPFVRALPRARWPRLATPARRVWPDDLAPACGTRALDAASWPELMAGLDQLAAFLYRRELFHAVLALDAAPRGGRQPAFALVLRVDDADTAHVLEYQPEACRFVPVAAPRPLTRYALGLECWASDLWRVLVGHQLPQRLLGHLRTWSFSQAPLSPLFAVWGFFDALNRPAPAAAFYAGQVRALADRSPTIAAGRHARRPLRR